MKIWDPGPPFQRHFIVSTQPLAFTEAECFEIAAWSFAAGKGLRISKGASVVVLGLAVDTRSGEVVTSEWVSTELDPLASPAEVARRVDELSGRFVAVAARGRQLTLIPDALASKTVFFGEGPRGVFASSNASLALHKGAWVNEPIREYVSARDSARMRQLEFRTLGSVDPETGMGRVLPNHVLVLEDRGPIETQPAHSVSRHSTPLAEMERLLRQTARGLSNLSPGGLCVPLSAGFDSRLVAAAVSAEVSDSVEAVTFRIAGGADTESETAARLAAVLGWSHSSIDLPAMSEPLFKQLQHEQVVVRDLPKLREIQAHIDRETAGIVLNGNGGEALSGGYFGRLPVFAPQVLRQASVLGPGALEYERQAWTAWLDSARPRAAELSLSLEDLWYWEQRMSHWGAKFFQEKDCGIDELSFFSCRSLLSTSGLTDLTRDQLFVELISRLHPGLLRIPVNPLAPRAGLRRFPLLRILGQQGRGLIRRTGR